MLSRIQLTTRLRTPLLRNTTCTIRNQPTQFRTLKTFTARLAEVPSPIAKVAITTSVVMLYLLCQ